MPTGVYIRTEEYRQKQREAMFKRVNPGKNKSEATRKKIGDAQRGKAKSEEFKNKCRKRMSGVAFFKCNLVLGHANDNIEILKSAISYLEKWA